MPLKIVPLMVLGGVILSGVDVLRRIGLEEIMKREEQDEINKELRKS